MVNRFLELERQLGGHGKGHGALAVRTRRRRARARGARPTAMASPGSSVAQALAAVKKFAAGKGGVWHSSLVRSDVADRLRELVNDPWRVDQGSLNLCGPAAFFHLWLKRDPLAAVQYAASMYDKRRASVGSLSVKAGDDLVGQDYGAVKARMSAVTPSADWMMLSALRDSENAAMDFEGTPEEDVSGITTPAEVASWLRATGLYGSVKNDAEWMRTKGVAHAKAHAPGAKRDVVCLINSHILSAAAMSQNKKKASGLVLSNFPNHFIPLQTPITAGTTGKLGFDCWTWGYRKLAVSLEPRVFEANYYGAVTAGV